MPLSHGGAAGQKHQEQNATPLTGFPDRCALDDSPTLALEVISIVPSERLGSLRDSVIWSRTKVERWIELGERDGKQALRLLTNQSSAGYV